MKKLSVSISLGIPLDGEHEAEEETEAEGAEQGRCMEQVAKKQPTL